MAPVPRRLLTLGLLAASALVALLTLLPEGSGWAWGSPLAELRWYATGLGSEKTDIQLVGNFVLLAPLSALAVLRWPALGRWIPLTGAGLATGTAIELLQRLLPLGRVVSPVDAVLNASGAVVAGLVAAGTARLVVTHPVRPAA